MCGVCELCVVCMSVGVGMGVCVGEYGVCVYAVCEFVCGMCVDMCVDMVECVDM